MANWNKIGRRGSVDDRRGMRGGAALGGGMGLAGIALFIGMNYFFNDQSVLDSLVQLSNSTEQQYQTEDAAQYEGVDEYEQFAQSVLGSANEVWEQKFNSQGREYTPPTLVLFRQSTQSACGGARSQVGPHYCPADKNIYLDETFFDVVKRQFGARGGDVAQAYVVAHEVGHHVQNITGGLSARTRHESIDIELQADCYAGIWANGIKSQGVFEPGEIEEAMDMAAAVGDDRIQERTQGSVNTETWTHGSSKQRKQWFTKGYESGSVSACEVG